MYKAIHEIVYPDELAGRGTIRPGSILNEDQVKAIEKDLPSLLKSGAVKETKQKVEKAYDPDVIGSADVRTDTGNADDGAGDADGDADATLDADGNALSENKGDKLPGIFGRRG